MTKEYIIRLVAGIFVLIGTALMYWVSPWFFILPVFVSINLIQSVFTGFCPLEKILNKMMR